MRRVIAALVVVALAIAVVLLWPRSDPDDPDVTVAAPSSTTSTTLDETTSTSGADTTSTTDDGSHVVETVEEAEAILTSHYDRWFRGIYEEDPALIRSTVILESQVDAAVDQFGVMEFSEPPNAESIALSDTEILMSTGDCLAAYAVVSASFRPGSSQGVVVFRFVDAEWKFLSSWQSVEDRWEEDCEASL